MQEEPCPARLVRMQNPSRRWVWAMLVLAAVLSGAAAVLFLVFRDTATPATVDVVTRSVPGLGDGDGSPGSAGIYQYATVGFETADVFAGGQHDYPAETYLTLRPHGCGTEIRWQPLEERFDEIVVCEDGRLATINSLHTWFGVAEVNEFGCDADARTYPQDGQGDWSFNCEKAGDSVQAWQYEVRGSDSIEVGGDTIEALHVVGSYTVTGRTTGTAEIHEWLLPGTHLPLRRTSVMDNVTDTALGPVTYHEEFEITLVSLTPRSS